jgi:hypothetical protein
MVLQPITVEAEISRHFDAVRRNLESMGVKVSGRISWRPNYLDAEVVYVTKHNMWFALDPPGNKAKNRFWNVFGVDDPADQDRLRIKAEINIYHEGYDARIAGGFCQETAAGPLYLYHDGRLGGGRTGMTVAKFWEKYNRWSGTLLKPPGNRSTKKIVTFGPIEDQRLVDQIAKFVHWASDYRSQF